MKKFLHALAAPRWLFWLLPWLMILLVAGTVAQRWIGAHEASATFFGSMILWLGPLPLPGGGLTMALLCLNLAARMAFGTAWHWRHIGSILTHGAVLLLLAGGSLAALKMQEGYIVLAPGESAAAMQDYLRREFVVLKNGESLSRTDFGALRKGQSIAAGPLTLEITHTCDHCAAVPDESSVTLKDAPPPKETEARQSGLIYRLTGAPDERNGLQWQWEGAPQPLHFKIDDDAYEIALRRVPKDLPFTVTLDDFTRSAYPGSDMARAYLSRVTVKDNDATHKGVIEMNAPLHYRDYVLYQSSYVRKDGREASVLTVVYNPWRTLPYYATGLLALGLILQAMRRMRRRGAAMVLLALALASPAAAADKNMADFRAIPVLHEGRIKPMESFARAAYAEISGRRAAHDATPWLADALFEPQRVADRPVIAVDDAETRALLRLPESEVYSLRAVASSLADNADLLRRAEVERASGLGKSQSYLLDLAGRVRLYQELTQSFLMLMPLAGGDTDFIEAQKDRESWREKLKRIVAEKGGDLELYTEDEATIAHRAMMLDLIGVAGEQNHLLRVMPPQWSADGPDWRSPWASMLEGSGSPATGALFDAWKQAMTAWSTNDADAWNAATRTLRDNVKPHADPARLAAEVYYDLGDPFAISLGFYALALLLLAAQVQMRREEWGRAAALVLAAGLSVHGLGLALRIYLLARPPVSDLYESILFVGFIVALIMFGWARAKRAPTGLWIAATLGVILQATAKAFAFRGDTLGVLLPVLDTHFWLATHVVCITSGYGLCLVTSALAHAALWRGRPETAELALKIFALLALLFTATGTLLGGIWADQSWGRFWGWDPKENGALLIALWLIWLLHGRIAGQLPRLVFTAGLAALGIIVALAWFGVNFLGVGLHSYGFAEQGVMGLAAFVALELAVIFGLWRRAHA